MKLSSICGVGLVVFGSFLIGCASLNDQGYKAMKQGEYENALALFEKAVQQSPNDGKAREGLRTSQQEWLNRKLIDVRLLRLSGNLGESEDLLLKVINDERQWQVFPTGAAFSTQKEEIQLFSSRIEKRIRQYLEEKNPIAAQIELNRNQFIFEQAKSPVLTDLKSKIYAEALTYCKTSLSELKPNEYFTHAWLKQTCDSWGIPLAKINLKSSVTLFKDVRVLSKIQNLDSELQSILSKDIEGAFRQSKWQDSSGKVILQLEPSGEFLSGVDEKNVSRSKEYTVEIPYTETFKRVKDPRKNKGVGGVISLLAAFSGDGEQVVDNGDGTEQVTMTRYRSETRHHHYKAVEVRVRKVLVGSIQAKLDNQNFELELMQNYRSNQDRHNQNFPDVGLRPSNPKVLSDQDWIKSLGQEIISDISRKLQQSWIERFCAQDLKGSNLSQRELMHRCTYQVTAQAPQHVEQYYLKNLKISFEDWIGFAQKASQLQ